MNIYIRVDSHFKIGIGHIMRCLNLCSHIENYNSITFICKKYKNIDEENNLLLDNIFSKITNKYNLIYIEKENDNYININNMTTWLGEEYTSDAIKTINVLKNCDILIIDHYAIDYKWENIIKKYVNNKIIVIEDFISRKHNCDIIINCTTKNKLLYSKLVNFDCKLFIGNHYAIIGKDFFNNDENKRQPFRISVFISGSDLTNETTKILKACKKINLKYNNKYVFDFIVGGLNKHYKEIEKLCDNNKYILHFNIDNMVEILKKSSISIGAVGQSLLERIALNIPSIIFTISENQEKIIHELTKSESFIFIGRIPIDYQIELEKNILKLNDQKYYTYLAENCKNFIKNNKINLLINKEII